ncbi:hypothetical protein NC652_014498 [Populus alba x Populus x berolinensis]|nr:hypothetical protein NC652_014498 [Populus alba x Populus x berolinensis]
MVRLGCWLYKRFLILLTPLSIQCGDEVYFLYSLCSFRNNQFTRWLEYHKKSHNKSTYLA